MLFDTSPPCDLISRTGCAIVLEIIEDFTRNENLRRLDGFQVDSFVLACAEIFAVRRAGEGARRDVPVPSTEFRGSGLVIILPLSAEFQRHASQDFTYSTSNSRNQTRMLEIKALHDDKMI